MNLNVSSARNLFSIYLTDLYLTGGWVIMFCHFVVPCNVNVSAINKYCIELYCELRQHNKTSKLLMLLMELERRHPLPINILLSV